MIPFDSERWTFEVQGSELVEHLGRQSLFLKDGRVWLRDVELLNGVIEFDVALPKERSFIGAFWRMQDSRNYEHFYLRPQQSGQPDACQYTPVINGVSAWQLYSGPGHAAVIDFEPDAWTSVKIEIWDDAARVHVDGAPLMIIHDLKREPAPGRIGLEVPAFAPAHFSRFRCRKLEQEPFERPAASKATAPAGTVRSWSVSSVFPEASLLGNHWIDPTLDQNLEWTTLASEESGIANLARVQGLDVGDTCSARIVMDVEHEQSVDFTFGFSDRVRVYLDGCLIYAGDNSYRSRDHRFLGTIGPFDRLILPLHAGPNELRLAVSEGFGGWGLLGRLKPEVDIASLSR
ncbi:MAG: hypothetical protein ACI8QZ_002989 [Chlamydiales bacterium]